MLAPRDARPHEYTERAHKLASGLSDEATNNLGAICHAKTDHESTVRWYREAVRASPNNKAMVQNLSVALLSLGSQIMRQDPKRAIRCFQEVLARTPTDAEALHHLGMTYAQLRKHDKALIFLKLAAHFDPKRAAIAHNEIGSIYNARQEYGLALQYYELALRSDPGSAQALNNIGAVCITTGRLDDAFQYLMRAKTADPNHVEAYKNLGWLLWDYGQIDLAVQMYESCIRLQPLYWKPSQNRLLSLNYLPWVSMGEVFEAHRAWGERFCREIAPLASSAWLQCPPSRERQLRLGYVSPDLFHHSVSFFAQCLFEHRDSAQFDIFVYSNAVREDDKTEMFKSMVPVEHWRRTNDQTAVQVAQQIRDDRVDILIDLAGHTANNRLDIMAQKPAPLQFTYIGYCNTTGLGAIDYRISDEVTDPPETQQRFVEELVRLPGCFLCYTPPAQVPDIGELPALRIGSITFGSFSCLAKVSDPCIACWARILAAVPRSRLVMKNKGFFSRDVRARIVHRFSQHSIPEHRLRLLALAPTPFEHLALHGEVDIMLDTFPYANTTLTCEALLMGVPPVCLKGETHGSRVGASLIGTVGLADVCVAGSLDDYVLKASSLANDLDRLSQLRLGLRRMVLASHLCDGRCFMRERFEHMLHEKWRLYCEGRPPAVQSFASEQAPEVLAPRPFGPPLATHSRSH